MNLNLPKLNEELVKQDDELRRKFSEIGDMELPGEVKLYGALIAGLCAIHERQGNMIMLMLGHGR